MEFYHWLIVAFVGAISLAFSAQLFEIFFWALGNLYLEIKRSIIDLFKWYFFPPVLDDLVEKKYIDSIKYVSVNNLDDHNEAKFKNKIEQEIRNSDKRFVESKEERPFYWIYGG